MQPEPGQFWTHKRTGRTVVIERVAGRYVKVRVLDLSRGQVGDADPFHRRPSRLAFITLAQNYEPVSAKQVRQRLPRPLPYLGRTIDQVYRTIRGPEGSRPIAPAEGETRLVGHHSPRPVRRRRGRGV